jgi:general secretion pathway protein F
MPDFAYKAVDRDGRRLSGVLSGASEHAVLIELEARRLVPISVRAAVTKGRGVRISLARVLGRSGSRAIGARAMATSYQQLADLLRAGVPLLRGLRLLGSRTSRPASAEVFRALSQAVEQGRDLADAMADHPSVFPPVHAAMVRAGEKGGFLEAVLARLGQLLTNQAELRSKVLGNLVYPMLLIVFGAIIFGVVFGVFVPMFRPIFAQIPSLPPVTRVVFGLSDFLGKWGWLGLVLAAIAGVGLWRGARRAGFRRRLAIWRTTMPIIGGLTRSLATARFARLLGTMLSNGIPMLQAMRIAKQAAGNVLVEDAIERAAEAVRAGRPMVGPMRESGLFADDILEMMDVAESANNLDAVLITIADTTEERIDRMLTSLVRLIEPLLLLMIALVVAVVAAALILPMTRFKSGL